MSISFASSLVSASPSSAPVAGAERRPFTPASAGLVRDPAQRKAIRLGWKTHVSAMAARADLEHKGPSARDLAVYCMLLGIPLHRAFTPVTNEVKLANGRTPFDGLLLSVQGLTRRTERGLTLEQLLVVLGLATADVPALCSALQAEARSLTTRSLVLALQAQSAGSAA